MHIIYYDKGLVKLLLKKVFLPSLSIYPSIYLLLLLFIAHTSIYLLVNMLARISKISFHTSFQPQTVEIFFSTNVVVSYRFHLIHLHRLFPSSIYHFLHVQTSITLHNFACLQNIST